MSVGLNDGAVLVVGIGVTVGALLGARLGVLLGTFVSVGDCDGGDEDGACVGIRPE